MTTPPPQCSPLPPYIFPRQTFVFLCRGIFFFTEAVPKSLPVLTPFPRCEGRQERPLGSQLYNLLYVLYLSSFLAYTNESGHFPLPVTDSHLPVKLHGIPTGRPWPYPAQGERLHPN